MYSYDDELMFPAHITSNTTFFLDLYVFDPTIQIQAYIHERNEDNNYVISNTHKQISCNKYMNYLYRLAYISTLFFTGIEMNPTILPLYPSIAQT